MNNTIDHSDPLSRTAATTRKGIQAAAIYDFSFQLAQIKEGFLPQAKAKNIQLALNVIDEIPAAFWDMESLHNEVLATLLNTAIHNTPAGGKVELSVRKPDNYTATLKVSCSASNMSDASELDVREQELSRALTCVLAHKGTMDLTQTAELPGAEFEIKLPLFALCLQ